MNNLRNRVACWIANFALNHIATRAYRNKIDGLMARGIYDTYGVRRSPR